MFYCLHLVATKFPLASYPTNVNSVGTEELVHFSPSHETFLQQTFLSFNVSVLVDACLTTAMIVAQLSWPSRQDVVRVVLAAP